MLSSDFTAMRQLDVATRELQERNAARVAAFKLAMGKKFVLHPANAPKRKRVKSILG